MSVFEVVRGVEGCCLVVDDVRIAGPKPWGGGTVIHTFETSKEYKATNTRSRWYGLFGTPEKAANILALGCMGAPENVCDSCVFRECDGKLRRCGSIHSIAMQMLEWLNGDAE